MAKVFKQLEACSFSADDPAFKFFGAEVFHDSPLEFGASPASQVFTLHLVNTYLMDVLDRLHGKHVDEQDLVTTVECAKCSEVEVDLGYVGKELYYHSSELTRGQTGLEICIAKQDFCRCRPQGRVDN